MVYRDWLHIAHHTSAGSRFGFRMSSIKQVKDAGIRPSHVESQRHGNPVPHRCGCKLAVNPICQQALPLRFPGFCTDGPCNCFSVYISCGKFLLGMIIPETKASGWSSRLLYQLTIPCRPVALVGPGKRLAGKAVAEEGGCWELYTLFRKTHHTDDSSSIPSCSNPQICWRSSLPLQRSVHS